MEVDLQSCGTLFSLLPSDIKCQQKYVESLFRSLLVCSEFYALYFFIFWGFFYCSTFFSWMDGSGFWTSWSLSLCPSSWLVFHLHSEVCILRHFAFTAWILTCEELKILKQSRSCSSQSPCCPFTLAGLQLRVLGGDGLGRLLLVLSTCTRSLQGFILLISTCWSLCQLVWVLSWAGLIPEMWEPVPQSGLC